VPGIAIVAVSLVGLAAVIFVIVRRRKRRRRSHRLRVVLRKTRPL
jgi:hypothetical protein